MIETLLHQEVVSMIEMTDQSAVEEVNTFECSVKHLQKKKKVDVVDSGRRIPR